MKYGRLCFSNESISDSICNLGDIVQVLAIDSLYRQMAIPDEDIVNILLQDLGNYRGEKILLPVNAYIKITGKSSFFPMSEDIIPIFLSIHCDDEVCSAYRDYFKRYEPVGCRDESTYRAMKKHGIDAYLLGCITITLPRRECAPPDGRVFIVDLHPRALRRVPAAVKENAVYLRQDIPLEGRPLTMETACEMEKLTKERYQQLRDQAGMVITSRLHIAAPCLAMGIPVILMRNGFDDRFSWIDRYLPLYDVKGAVDVDWGPLPVDLEQIKAKIRRTAMDVLRREYDREQLDEITQFYLSRTKTKLKMSFLARTYVWMCGFAPGPANFIRDKILFRFTISGSNIK